MQSILYGGKGRGWGSASEETPRIFEVKSHALKTLPLTPIRSRLWQENAAKVLIPIYRTTAGVGYPARRPQSGPSAELDDSSSVSFVGTSRGQLLPLPHRLALGRNFHPLLAARIGLAVKGLCNRSRPADFAQDEHFDFKVAPFVGDAQHVSNANLARRFADGLDIRPKVRLATRLASRWSSGLNSPQVRRRAQPGREF